MLQFSGFCFYGQNGYLFNYLPSEEAKSILISAAKKAQTNSKIAEAISLFGLAGVFNCDVVSIRKLNRTENEGSHCGHVTKCPKTFPSQSNRMCNRAETWKEIL